MRPIFADLILLSIAIIWGSTFVMVKDAISFVPPIQFNALRFLLGALLMVVFFYKRLASVNRIEWFAGAITGLSMGAGYIFQTVGLQYTTSGKAGFITGLYVVLVPLFSLFILRKSPGWLPLIGACLATVGFGFLSLRSDLSFGVGEFSVFLAAVMFALQVIFISKYVNECDPVRLTIVQMITVAALATVGSLSLEQMHWVIPLRAWGAILFTGIIASVLVFYLQIVAQKYTTPTRAGLILGSEALFAALFGWLLAGEVFGIREWIGAGFILTGITIAELKRRKNSD